VPPVGFPFVEPIAKVVLGLEEDVLGSGRELNARIGELEVMLNGNLRDLRALSII
jgi:hypothetical protein